jgi:hypothetical protein
VGEPMAAAAWTAPPPMASVKGWSGLAFRAELPGSQMVQKVGVAAPIAHPMKGWASRAFRAELPPDTVAAHYRWLVEP